MTASRYETATDAARRTHGPATTVGDRHAPSRDGDSNAHRRAADEAIHANTTHLDVHLGPVRVHLSLPPVDKLAFYAGLGGAAAFGVIEWPVAVITGVGHALSENRHHRTMRALGEALDAA
jgi:hypothetical protein